MSQNKNPENLDIHKKLDDFKKETELTKNKGKQKVSQHKKKLEFSKIIAELLAMVLNLTKAKLGNFKKLLGFSSKLDEKGIKKEIKNEIQAHKQAPETTSQLAQNISQAKTLTVTDSLMGLFDKKGQHNLNGQCEGIMKYTFQKAISKITGKYKHLYLRGTRIARRTTALHRGKSVKKLKDSDFASLDEANNPNKIQPGTVFFVARNRPNLAKFMKGSNRRKRAPVNKSSGRHWFVYLGVINGKKCMGDNHTGKRGPVSIARMGRFLPGRIIVNLHDPLAKYEDRLAAGSDGRLARVA